MWRRGGLTALKKTPRPRPLPPRSPVRSDGRAGDATRYAYRTAPPRGPRRVRRPKRRSAEREPRGGRCGAPAEGPILAPSSLAVNKIPKERVATIRIFRI